MRRALKTLLVVPLLLVAVSACNSSGCIENRNAIPLAELCGSDGRPVVLDSLQIGGVDAPRDSILKPILTRVSKVYLPMRSTQQTTAWCFAYKWKRLDDPRNYDTITFDYRSIPYFDSEECGATYRYRITRVGYTNHLIDSVEMVDSLITNEDRTYLKIYFRTATE